MQEVGVGAGCGEVSTIGAIWLVPIPRRDHQHVVTSARSNVVGDPHREVATTLNRQGAALTEVLLEVDDDEGRPRPAP